MQRSPITSLKVSLASKARGAAFDLLNSSIPLGMQHRLRIVCLWTSTHFQKQLRYKGWVDIDTSGCQVWSLYRSLHPPQKKVMKHHNHLFLPDISGYNFTAPWYLKFLLYWWGWTLTCCHNNILHFYSTCGCSRMEHCCWACTQLSSYNRFILSVSLKISMCMETIQQCYNAPNLHIQSSNVSRYLATATASHNPCISMFTIIISSFRGFSVQISIFLLIIFSWNKYIPIQHGAGRDWQVRQILREATPL